MNNINEDSLMGKVQPQAVDLECSILGAILIDYNAFDIVSKTINSDSFYNPSNKCIFKACNALFNRNYPIDLVTVAEELLKINQLEQIGGALYLSELTNKVASTANISVQAHILEQYSMRRKLIRHCQEATSLCYDLTSDIFDNIDNHSQKVAQITASIRKSQIQAIGNVMFDTVEDMLLAKNNKQELLGIPSGINNIDTITLGFANSDNIVIAAGAGEGKSTFALQTAINASVNYNIPVLYFSLEMVAKQLAWKIFSSEVHAKVSDIRKGNLLESQWKKIYDSYDNKYKNAPLFITDIAGLSIFDVISISRTTKSEHGLGMIVIDYLQLLNADGSNKKFGIREQEVAFISRKIKELAKELNVPILSLSQLSRMDKTTKRLYQLSDLRESGAIEQDADMVIFFWNPERHGVDRLNANDAPFQADTIIPIIAKNRLGDTGLVENVMFNGKHSRYEDRF